jgi:hypothetical protein
MKKILAVAIVGLCLLLPFKQKQAQAEVGDIVGISGFDYSVEDSFFNPDDGTTSFFLFGTGDGGMDSLFVEFGPVLN